MRRLLLPLLLIIAATASAQTIPIPMDVEIGYRFSRITVAVGAQNLFDTFPDRNLEPNSNLGIFTYPSSSPFGMNGRFVYTRASIRF